MKRNFFIAIMILAWNGIAALTIYHLVHMTSTYGQAWGWAFLGSLTTLDLFSLIIAWVMYRLDKNLD